MLTMTHRRPRRPPYSGAGRRERGVVLFITLIVLVAMLLAGLSLLRSVTTSNRVAGNLAFQEAATQSADVGIETAIAWLETTLAATPLRLHDHITVGAVDPVGYFAVRQDPDATTAQSWQDFWDQVLLPSGGVTALPADASGNTVSFVIHRLCSQTGDPATGRGCATSPSTAGSDSGSRGAGVVGLLTASAVYYRITARVDGPRNTVRFVQAVVSM
jgi:hypothetical protein